MTKQLDMHRTSVHLPKPLLDFITARAQRRGVERSEVIREGLFMFMEMVEPQAFSTPVGQASMTLEDHT